MLHTNVPDARRTRYTSSYELVRAPLTSYAHRSPDVGRVAFLVVDRTSSSYPLRRIVTFHCQVTHGQARPKSCVSRMRISYLTLTTSTPFSSRRNKISLYGAQTLYRNYNHPSQIHCAASHVQFSVSSHSFFAVPPRSLHHRLKRETTARPRPSVNTSTEYLWIRKSNPPNLEARGNGVRLEHS